MLKIRAPISVAAHLSKVNVVCFTSTRRCSNVSHVFVFLISCILVSLIRIYYKKYHKVTPYNLYCPPYPIEPLPCFIYM